MTTDILNSSVSNDEQESYIYSISSNNTAELLINLQTAWLDLTAFRHNKIIKNVFTNLPKNEETQQQLEKVLSWAKEKNKTNLIKELELQLSEFLLYTRDFQKSLSITSNLEKEYKKTDDKVKLTEVYLIESRAYYELGSFEKAKTSLSMAKNISLTVLCSRFTSAMIDLMNGIYLCDDKDYHPAVSYFLECLELFSNEQAENVVCYIILAKILLGQYEDVDNFVLGKKIVKFASSESVKIMFSIKNCVQRVEIREFKDLISSNTEILGDRFIKKHLIQVYNKLLTENILKLIRPYSVVKISFLAEQLEFSCEEIEGHVRGLILDGEIFGNIDHEQGVVVIRESESKRNFIDKIISQL